MMPGGPSPAEMLLSHTGELKLTDQQVVRLAAIARRAADRRRAFRTRLDSLRAANPPAANAPGANPPAAGQPPAPSGPLAAQLTQMREQERTDLRDALAVLTPDQQAQAWEMAVARPRVGAFARGAAFGGGFGGDRPRRARPGRGGPPRDDDGGEER
jgi:hypothetical protein